MQYIFPAKFWDSASLKDALLLWIWLTDLFWGWPSLRSANVATVSDKKAFEKCLTGQPVTRLPPLSFRMGALKLALRSNFDSTLKNNG